MEFVPDTVRAVGETFGLTGFILVLAAGVVAVSIWLTMRSEKSTRGSPVVDVVPVMTCKVSDFEDLLHEIRDQNALALARQQDVRADAQMALNKLDRIDERLIRVEDRTAKR